jgi:type II secretory pathway pseudopilin PulG
MRCTLVVGFLLAAVVAAASGAAVQQKDDQLKELLEELRAQLQAREHTDGQIKRTDLPSGESRETGLPSGLNRETGLWKRLSDGKMRGDTGAADPAQFPTDAAPADPAPTDPAPVAPADPTDPAPTDPAPTDPADGTTTTTVPPVPSLNDISESIVRQVAVLFNDAWQLTTSQPLFAIEKTNSHTRRPDTPAANPIIREMLDLVITLQFDLIGYDLVYMYPPKSASSRDDPAPTDLSSS